MAIVGSGPAGFYTAYRVMTKIPGAKVDMYESLPVPFGLVRHGVAPDHPEVKNCQDKFDEVASSPNFTFIGNVSVGEAAHQGEHNSVELQSLMRNYDSVLFAYGASQDKKLGIPGESTLKGIYSARQFVGWYNGHPDCAALAPDLTRGDEAVIVGQGNVALDVARMLLEDVDVLRKTDITEHALAEIARSKIRRVHVVGRRGPMQAAFTIKEVRELMKLKDVSFHGIDKALVPEDLKSLPRASKRMMEVLVKGTPTSPTDTPRSWSLDSCLAPTHFLAHHDQADSVSSTQFEITKLANPFDPRSSVETSNQSTVLPSSVVFRSVGYKSTPLPGFAEAGIQFDERKGTVDNDGLGRVTRLVSEDAGEHIATQQVPGLYCAGWLKNGPTGVIASTMQDAFTTGEAIAQDWASGASFLQSRDNKAVGGWASVRQSLPDRGQSAVAWSQWRQIELAEKERGQRQGKLREKFINTNDMLAVLS
ncbi:pyridine nucleotide-disulfide oxidoreductase domain-containing protein [Sarocladium implicatum]|nr:pyridine nucleotide-disulfide oxidoreductase domain-containing protein [Sarocladium implicatum]